MLHAGAGILAVVVGSLRARFLVVVRIDAADESRIDIDFHVERTIWEGPELEAGRHTIVFDFKSAEPGLGKGGSGVLSVDGKEVARNTMEHTTPITFPEDETFDVGQDTRTGVALLEYRYDVPFKFSGKINKLTFKLEPEPQTQSKN